MTVEEGRGTSLTDAVILLGGLRPRDPETSAALNGPLQLAYRRLQQRVGRSDGSAGPIPLQLAEDVGIPPEGFRLQIGHDGVSIAARDHRGHRYGLHALARLVQTGAGTVEPVVIRDCPRLPVRGLLIDAGRRYWQPETLRRVLDEMAWHGLNRLQLHLTEWNAFRIRLSDPRFAGLAGPNSYSAADLNDLIGQAHQRGIEVSVELNLPGHCTALIAAQPQLGMGPQDAALRDGSPWTGHPTDAWMIDVTSPVTRAFCADLLRALVAEVHADAFHLGGDEWFHPAQLAKSPALQRRAAELTAQRRPDRPYDPADAVVDFLNDMCEVVEASGGRPELWSWWHQAGARQLKPSTRVTITAWGAGAESTRLAAAGYRVVASPEDTHYITPRTAPGNLAGVNYVAADCGRLATEPLHSAIGEQLCIWSDWAENQPDEYFRWYALRPLHVFADRVWNGPDGGRSRVDEIAVAADATSDLVFSRVISGRELKLDAGQRLAGVRVNPTRGAAPESAAGKWSRATMALLDRWRGTVIELADEAGSWHPVHRLDLQPSPTWMTVPLQSLHAVAGRVRWAADGQPRDDQVEWLVIEPAKGGQPMSNSIKPKGRP